MNFDKSKKPFDIVRFIIESNAIEGYAGKVFQTGSPYFDDHLNAYYYAVQMVSEVGINKEVLLTGHNILTKELLPPSNSGYFRNHQVRVGVYVCPKASVIDFLIDNFIKEYRRKMTEQECWDSHFWFESIHPFIDGNGRWGRCLLNAMLLANGFEAVVVEYNQRFAYYDAIEIWRHSNWQRIMSEAINGK